ncbi:MAG: thiamine ABC transporter substrate-binding protein [Candidatus Cloacimonadaceae bacterium]|nr:thiamine ABC transporter substrate-binding protein [Candidatus Cloacimonadaceae bacterium]
MRQIGFFLLLIGLLAACNSKSDQSAPAPNPASTKTCLSIFALESIRTSGFEGALIKDYAKKFNCAVSLTLFPTMPELVKALIAKENDGDIDVVLNMDNCFALEDTLKGRFLPLNAIAKNELSRDLYLDPNTTFIPYAYANLGIIYNEKVFDSPPQSFGELQDAKYFRQMAICDPHQSGLGRATLYWTLALFGDFGYEHLWQSLRKNVKKVYNSPQQALEALKKGECSMMIGFNSTPAWLEELNQSDKYFKTSMLKEGSYQYSESAAIHAQTRNESVARHFIEYLISTEAQKMAIYKLGLFPANSKTNLPMRFARIPLSSWTVNKRLSEDQIRTELPVWLYFWDSLFNYGIAFAD